MEPNINVLNIQIDNYTAKAAMQKVVKYLQTEPISVVKIVTTDILVQAGDLPELKGYIECSDMVLAGERAILEAADITDKKMLQEVESGLFVQMFMHFMHKNKSRVFLLGATEEVINRFQEYMNAYYGGICLVGCECVTEMTPEDMVLNQVNGGEVDCIIALLPTPLQEKFIAHTKELFNANVWFGLGKNIKLKHENSNYKWWMQSLLTNRIFRKEIEREKRKKEL